MMLTTFYASILLFGIYLSVEAMTFGRWRSNCFFQRTFSLISSGQFGQLLKLLANANTKQLEDNSDTPEGYHLVPGVLFSVLGGIGIFLSRNMPAVAQITAEKTSYLVCFTILLLVVADSMFWFLGLEQTHDCLPSKSGTLSFGEVLTLFVYLVMLLVMIYSPSFF